MLQKRKSQPAGFVKTAMAKGPMRGFTANKMREEARKKARPEHYPAPYALIDLYEKYGDDPRKMSAAEIDAFVPLMGGDTATNLRRVFFLSEGLKKQGVKGKKPDFRRVHVIGAWRDGRRYRGLVCAARPVRDAAGSRYGAGSSRR